MKLLQKFIILLFVSSFLYYFVIVRVRNRCKGPSPSSTMFHSICYDEDQSIVRGSTNFFGKCLPPLMVFDSKFRLAESFKLASCVIEKNMFDILIGIIDTYYYLRSTLLTAIMCFLRDSHAFMTANSTLIDNNYQKRLCKDQNEFRTFEEVLAKNQTELKDWHLLAIVRDPIERFLSGYIDKCLNEANKTSSFRRLICYNCGTNLPCFIRRQFRRAQIYAERRGRPRIYWIFEDIHFFPQNWHCQFHSNFARFHLIHFGETADDRAKMHIELIEWLRTKGVPKKLLQTIQRQISHRQTGHSTKEEPIRQKLRQKLLGNKELKRMLLRMFYFDYVLFGLPFDEHLIN